MTFKTLGVIEPIIKALEAEGYERPTPIQEQSIPILLKGDDLLGCAQTGTGKTASFGIPILQHLYTNRNSNQQRRKIKALVVTPTRELAIQIGDSFTKYGRFTNLRNTVIFGGVKQGKQVRALQQGIDILVATPGRLLDLINQKIIVSVLKKSGMEIEIANNGQEALDMLFVEQKMFDIVLMDISMPVMDGLIATQHIRAREAYDKMPIITFTAFAMGSEIEEMFDAGCNAYLTKPLNIKKLYHAFSMFLRPSHREVSLHKTIEIEGLDIEVGIYNADESEVLYKETLKEFVLVYKDMSESIPKWIKEKRYERVKLACNEIDGILNAIGAYEMKVLVNDMQKHFLYSNEEFLDQYSRLYPEKFNNLIEAIEHYLQS